MQKNLKKQINFFQNGIDAILVLFVNFVAQKQGINYGLHTDDFCEIIGECDAKTN